MLEPPADSHFSKLMFNCWTLAARTFRMRRRSKCARAAERASSRVTTVRSPLRCSPRQTFNPILIGGAKSSGPGQTVLKAVAASAALAGFRAWTSALGCVSSIGRNLAFGGHRQVCLVICCRCGAPSSNQLIGHRLHFPGKSFAVLPKDADRIHPPGLQYGKRALDLRNAILAIFKHARFDFEFIEPQFQRQLGDAAEPVVARAPSIGYVATLL